MSASTTTAIDRWIAWDDFLETVEDTGFMQSAIWADFRGTNGVEYFGAILKHRGVTLGGAIVQKCFTSSDSSFYYIQDGPVLPRDEATAENVFTAVMDYVNARRAAEDQTISHLRIEPRWYRLPSFVLGFQPAPGDDDYTEPRRTLCVDLRQPMPTILEHMKPKGRYNVRLAAKRGVRINEDSSTRGLEEFYNIYAETTARQQIDVKPREYFDTLISLISPRQKVATFFAEYAGERIATALVVYFGQRATYFFGGSRDIYREVMAALSASLRDYESCEVKRVPLVRFLGSCP